jgi:hypothetical protein
VRTVIKYLILAFSLIILVVAYFYVIFWSERWKWKFWVSGELEDLLYLSLFTFVWGALIKAIWKLEVRLLF